MSEEYGSDYITISDDEGNEFELEHLDTLEYNDELYMSFLPADLDEDEESPEMIILKVIEENGEEVFSTLDSEEELESVYEKFIERLFDNSEDVDPDSDFRFQPAKPASLIPEDEDYSDDYMEQGDRESDFRFHPAKSASLLPEEEDFSDDYLDQGDGGYEID